MGKITIKQHYLPAFILKRWKINNSKNHDQAQYYDVNTGESKTFTIRGEDDPFKIDNYYEYSSKEPNEIENKLSQLEGAFANVLTKVEEQLKTSTKIKVNRKELFFIRLFAITQSTRSRSLQIAYETNDGDSAFRERHKGKSIEELKEMQINHLSKLLDLFHMVQEGKTWIEVMKEISSFFGEIDFEKIKHGVPLLDMVDETKFNVFKYLNWTFLNWIVIDEDFDNFVLTDSGPIQTNAKLMPIPFFEVLPVNPKLAICFVNKFFPSFPNYEIEKAGLERNFGKTDLVDWKIENSAKDKKPEDYNWEDWYLYDITRISNWQLSILNACRISQVKEYVVYIDEEDIAEALKRPVYRSEDQF